MHVGVINERRALQSGGVLIFFITIDGNEPLNVVVDQVGWLNDSLCDEFQDILRNQIVEMTTLAFGRGVRNYDLESHLSAKMRRYAQRLAGSTPHVAVIIESSADSM